MEYTSPTQTADMRFSQHFLNPTAFRLFRSDVARPQRRQRRSGKGAEKHGRTGCQPHHMPLTDAHMNLNISIQSSFIHLGTRFPNPEDPQKNISKIKW